MTARVVALDPGGTTGWVCADLEKEQPYVIVEAQQDRLDEEGLFELLDRLRPTHVVAEGFSLRYGKRETSVQLISRDLLGVSKLWCKQHGVLHTQQQASEGKGWCTDRKLRDLDMWFVGLDHARDAARHFVYWLTFGPGFQFAPAGW